jgi:hypothetical protein
MGCVPFIRTRTLEVPSSASLSSTPDYVYPIVYSTCPSSCCAKPTTGCGLIPIASFYSLVPPFIFWATLALACCYRFPALTVSQPCILLHESISMSIIIGSCSSSLTSVSLTGSTCGKGIVSTSTIPFLCAISFSASILYCRDLRLFLVLCVVWLSASTLGGVIMDTSFFVY